MRFKDIRINAWYMVGIPFAAVMLAFIMAKGLVTEAIFMALIVGAVAIAKDLVSPDPAPVVPAHIVEKMLDQECHRHPR